MAETEKARVLLVENEPDFLDLLELTFRLEGCETACARSGTEALHALEHSPFDVVVTDVRMSDGDGYAVLAHAKRDEPARPIVILVSAFSELSIETAFAMGAEAAFSKPFLLSDLVAKVNILLLPPEERWRRPVAEEASWHVAGSLSDTPDGAPFVGRGGLVLTTGQDPPSPGSLISFHADSPTPAVPSVRGTGRVWWVRPAPAGETVHCGVEFAHVSDECRDDLVSWLSDARPRHYIPGVPGDPGDGGLGSAPEAR